MSILKTIALKDQQAYIQEAELIEEAKENPQSFKRLYEKNYAQIFGFVLKRINDKQITADVVQQVFLKALSKIKDYEYRGFPYSAYLYRVAVNECNAFFKSSDRTRFVVLEQEFAENLVEEIEIAFAYNTQRQKLYEVIKLLKPAEIQLLELRFFEMRSFNEVGFILSISENLAKVRTYRLLEKMKKMMTK